MAVSLVAEYMRSRIANGSDATDETSAAAKLFGITQLLEDIFLHVGVDLPGFKSLFVLQGVNKKFNTTINESSKLRHLMFRSDTDVAGDIEPVLNPLLFDKGIRRVIYPAELSLWFVTGHWKRRISGGCCFVQFERYGDQGQNESPINPAGSWRDLKICRWAVTFELDVMVRGTEESELLERFIGTENTLATFVDIILGPWDEAPVTEEEWDEEEETAPEMDRASLLAAFEAIRDKAMRDKTLATEDAWDEQEESTSERDEASLMEASDEMRDNVMRDKKRKRDEDEEEGR